jgi:hypothetical protein
VEDRTNVPLVERHISYGPQSFKKNRVELVGYGRTELMHGLFVPSDVGAV